MAPQYRHSTLSLPVVLPSLLLIGALLLVCAVAPTEAGRSFGGGQKWITRHFSWFYVLAVGMFLILLLWLAFSEYGRIRLDPDDARPEFSFASWLAMLFAAGMGIGLMYFGVGEPMMHFLSPPEAVTSTPEAAREAMVTTFFHWGFHAWAIYATVGLVLAYFGFRYNLPLTIRSGLYPIFKERTRLDWLVRRTGPREASLFIAETALPALQGVSQELNERGLPSRVESEAQGAVALTVPQQGRRDFCYGVRIESRAAPAFNPLAAAQSNDVTSQFCEVVTFFADGRAGYDIQYLTRDEISADVLRQYERYLDLIQNEQTDLLNSAPEHRPV